MDYGNRPLSGTNVFEDTNDQVEPVLRRAIGFAGRISADAGATVKMRSDANALESRELAAFLNQGKSIGTLDEEVFILTTRSLEQRAGVRLTGYPEGSNENSLPVSDLIFQAQSGICHLMGDPDREPLKLGGHQASYIAGYAIYGALVSLVLHKKRFGNYGQAEVDVFSACTWVNWKAVAFGALGQEIKREGKQAEWPVFPTLDGHAAMVFFEPHWPKLLELINDPILRDEKLMTFAGRQKYRELYMPIFEQWFASKNGDEIAELMNREGIPNGVIATPTSILTDPLVKHRKGLTNIVVEENRTAKRPVPPERISKQVSANIEVRWQKSATKTNQPLAGVRVLDFGNNHCWRRGWRGVSRSWR